MESFEQNITPAIEARNLTKRFGNLTAVDNVSFQVGKGEIFGIVGPDGAGKTTTLRMLASIMDPDDGAAFITGLNTRTAASKVKDHLAYMSQRFGLYPDLTVLENIHFYADLYGVPKKGRKKRVTELLGFSQMQAFTRRHARDLSGGMKQKLQLICALIHTPAVLLLDEPTNGVDPVSRRDFWRILYSIVKQGVSILVTTAYLDEAERCDRIGLLNRGTLLATGTPHDLKQLMPGKILTIQSPDARKINKLLQNGLPDLDVNVFGDTVHIVCPSIEDTKKQVMELIRSSAMKVDDIKQALPSLEDILINMMEKNTPADKPPVLNGGTTAFKPVDFGLGPHIENRFDDPIDLGHPSGQPAVQADDLTRTFGSFTAVDHINFKVPKGEIFGFLGPNGAGKSTTIRMLCGLLSPSSGSGMVAGFDIFTQAEQIKQHIGYMSQKFSLYEDLTVEENIRFYGGIYGLKNAAMKKRKAWAIDMSGLAGHEKSLTRVLSAGWKQRLALACAILHEPPILFLDEPTSGVDPLSRRRFWDLIYSMADQGVTVFVTTHYMEEAEYCDRIALIYRGRMIAMGTPTQLKTQHMHEQILNITCRKPQETIQHLCDLPGVRDISLFGAGLHAVTNDPALAEEKIHQRFDALGITDFQIEQILPGMEDVFISLIEEDDRMVQAAGHTETQS
jgi:ABC-2 type transport system ATP-binding protein